jgi:RHS repeat-associated protein
VRAVDVTLANGAVVSSAYDYQVDLSDPNNTLSVTRLERTSTVNGRASRSVYDVPGRNITATSPEGRQSVVTLDANSRIVREETPGILPLDYEYDARGRLARVVQGDRETINDFDPTSGFLARVQTRRDATEFLTSTFSRDAIGRTTTSVDPDGAISNFEYDDGGNLLAINPPESGDRVHELSYGPLDQLTGYAPPEDPDNRDETYEYNDDNQLARHVAADGTEHTSAYQSSGLLSSLAVDGATWFTTAYQPDGLHNPIEITQAGVELGRPPATASFTYDGPEVASTRWAVAGVDRGIVAYDTSAFHSARTVVETVNGSPVVYQYDDDGLLVSAGGVAITRDPLNGRAVGITVGNVAETIGYEPHGAEDLSVVSFAGAELFRAELSHDLLGRVDAQSTAIDGVLQSRAYVYDLAGRLVEVRDGSGTVIEAYTVDARGNRLSAIGVDPTTVAYDFDDRILAYGDLSFEYNGRGDVTEIFGPSGTTTITYADTATTPHRIATAAGDVVTFEIGPSGSVLTRAVNGTATDEYLWGQSGRPALHTDPRTGVATRFVYAERSTVPTQMIRGGQSYALVTDVRGSVRLVVRASDGAVMQRLDYDSFGQVLSDTNPGFQPFGFGGGLYDPVTGFVHLGQRIYDPRLGRFLSVDPAGLGDGVNRYIYAGGDPINFVDPTGLGAIEYIEGGLEAFVGFGDHLTLGVSRRLRHAVGLGDVINECSGWYRGGQFVGEVLDYIGLATLAYGVLRWGLKGIAGRFARGRVERSGGFGKWTDPETLGSYSGRTAVERNRALDAVIAEDFASLNFTFKPQYSPYAGYGISSRNLGTQIGPKAFGSRAQLRDTIVHEELHHRWWRRGITARHHVAGSAMEQRFYKTVERYKRIRGW